VEEECFTADTFSLGTQVGTGPYPSPNAYSCAVACIELPACKFWVNMDESNYCMLLGEGADAGQMESVGAWFGSRLCDPEGSAVCAQIGACEIVPVG